MTEKEKQFYIDYKKSKNQLKHVGIVSKKDGIISVKLFDGTIYKGKEIAYQDGQYIGENIYNDLIGELVNISYATCGTDSGCEIGKPAKKCVLKNLVAKGKCAVVFLYKIDLKTEAFYFSYEQLKKFNELQLKNK
jgi:hypothetical protein